MRAEDFTRLLRRRSYRPLRVHLTNGRGYDVSHPDQIIVQRQCFDIGLRPDPTSGVVEAVERCSLLHVVRVEEFQPSSRDGAPPEVDGA